MPAQGYAKIGQTDKAGNLLSQLERLSSHRYVGHVSFALVHLALGENEKAIDDLEQACREPADPDVINLKIEPLLDSCAAIHDLTVWSRKSLAPLRTSHQAEGDLKRANNLFGETPRMT